MTQSQLKALYAALLKLLRPLIRVLLRNGVSFGTFADLAKWVFVDVASQEFGIKGRKQSTSRISTITGLSRREVMRIRNLPQKKVTQTTERHNRASRVIAGWRREKDFLDDAGNPKPLPMDGPKGSFGELARRFSGNVPARAIYDELLRLGAVQQMDDGMIHLQTRAYIPKSTDAGRLDLMGTDVAHLLSTIDYNMRPGAAGPRFQRKVAYDNLPDDVLADFHRYFSPKAQKLVEEADKWLSVRDRDANPEVEGMGRNRMGFGIFFFEEPYCEEDPLK